MDGLAADRSNYRQLRPEEGSRWLRKFCGEMAHRVIKARGRSPSSLIKSSAQHHDAAGPSIKDSGESAVSSQCIIHRQSTNIELESWERRQSAKSSSIRSMNFFSGHFQNAIESRFQLKFICFSARPPFPVLTFYTLSIYLFSLSFSFGLIFDWLPCILNWMAIGKMQINDTGKKRIWTKKGWVVWRIDSVIQNSRQCALCPSIVKETNDIHPSFERGRKRTQTHIENKSGSRKKREEEGDEEKEGRTRKATTTETNGIENTKRIDPLVHHHHQQQAPLCAVLFVRDSICGQSCTALPQFVQPWQHLGELEPLLLPIAQQRDGWTWNDDPSLASLSLSPLSPCAVATTMFFITYIN